MDNEISDDARINIERIVKSYYILAKWQVVHIYYIVLFNRTNVTECFFKITVTLQKKK